MRRTLFIVGAARTGTTALTNYLNHHPRMCILTERYKGIAGDVGPEHFHFSRVLAEARETNLPLGRYTALLESKDEQRLTWVGDKAYAYVPVLERVAENNPGLALMVTVRDPLAVAASYLKRSKNPNDTQMYGRDVIEYATRAMNRVLQETRRFTRRHPDVPLVIVDYEVFFSDPDAYEPLLTAVLEIDLSEQLVEWRRKNAAFAEVRKDNPLPKEAADRVRRDIKWGLQRWGRAFAEGQRAGARYLAR